MIRTALGDIQHHELGPTDYPRASDPLQPLLPGDDLDDEERSGAEAQALHDAGIAAIEVVERFDRLGVAADRIALAHLDRNPDPGVHAKLAAAGAFLGYDGWRATPTPPTPLCSR